MNLHLQTHPSHTPLNNINKKTLKIIMLHIKHTIPPHPPTPTHTATHTPHTSLNNKYKI